MDNGSLYVNGNLVSGATLSYRGGMQPSQVRHEVFISHQRQDLQTAKVIAILLSRAGHPCYLDEFDPQVDGDSPDLESYLRRVIGNSLALLALVSNNTVHSWWVPMEIGVALDREKHIGTYLMSATNLPSYLWRWPVLRSPSEASTWADHVGKTQPEQYYAAWRGLSFQRKSVDQITVG